MGYAGIVHAGKWYWKYRLILKESQFYCGGGGASKDTMDRRKHRRIPMQMHAEIEIVADCSTPESDSAKSICGRVNTIDVSLGGFCVKVDNSQTITDKRFSPAIAYTLVGKTITVFFRDNDMVISGKVVRIEPGTMLMAVVITKVSDINLWREFCGQIIYDQSVQG